MKNRGMRFFVIVFILMGVPVNVVAENSLYETYLNSGWEARKAKDYEEAEKNYSLAFELNSESSDPKVGLLYTYIENEDFKKAEVIADKCLKSYPDNLWVRKGAAWTFYNRKRYDDAIAQYSYVLQQDDENPDMKLGLGLSLYFTGRKAEARDICLSCQDDFDDNDERLRLCLGENDYNWKGGDTAESEQGWRFSSSLYYSYTDYSDSLAKETANTLTVSIEALHMYGLGLYLQGSGMIYSQKEASEKCHQYSTSGALFYYTPVTSVWVNLTHLNGDEDGGVSSETLSLYGSKRLGLFHVGIERSTGEYGDFETVQHKAELGLYLGNKYFVKLSGMVQESDGDLYSMFQESEDELTLSLTEIKTRYSIGLDLNATYDSFTLNLSGYHGERWFTVEDRGLNIWNVDEEFEWGSQLDLTFHRNKNRAYYLSVRGDKVNKQSGLDNAFYILGITTGIKINF